ncbi:PREDICTED: calcitonin gene-related peptide type 1 receptor-like [Nicrophorus vespilloides]|uniref:Calcitonin gene-related peptide type 1 receptor-like n=1 Tax=Nicrophorus vespilloides TaxID=110193 RepID=A0ABM1MFN0_NICVS|nr:PREDICTED: calcitonin gene-related peptide type 1 receptor-like [Nicrophorus vespilloides]
MRHQLALLLTILVQFSHSQDEKRCLLRFFPIAPAEDYKFATGDTCFFMSSPFWLNIPAIKRRTLVKIIDGKQFPISYTIDPDGREVFFDYENQTALEHIQTLYLQEAYFKKWYDCANAAMDCCLNHLTEENMQPDEDHPCPALWDGYTCYGKTKAGTTVYNLCPSYIRTADDLICNLESEKYCLTDGWNQVTNYNTCVDAPIYRKRNGFHLICLYVSVAVIFPAILIYLSFPKLKILRIALHRNLLIAIFIKNVLVILSKNLIILDALEGDKGNKLMISNSIGCRVLAFFENLSKNLIFTCMSADAFYLHKLIVRPFATDPNILIFYSIVVVFSALPSLIWAGLMGAREMENCWMVDTETWYIWITDGYKYAMLIINAILLVDIIRVLLTKLGKGGNKKQTRSALKATIILLPLFGIPLLITSQRDLFDSRDCTKSDIYYYITYAIEAAQGILLAVFFCYLNQDVHKEIANFYRKLDTKFRQRFGYSERMRRSTACTKSTKY